MIQTTDTRASVFQSEAGTVYVLTRGELGTLKALEGRWQERIEVIDCVRGYHPHVPAGTSSLEPARQHGGFLNPDACMVALIEGSVAPIARGITSQVSN